MEKYLQELIRNNNRVIIPDFGAFIVSHDKGQHILFNNFLSFNDGLLVSHICDAEGINSDKALVRIHEFVAEIKETLKQNEQFKIAGIGTLIQKEGTTLAFEAEIPENEKVEMKEESPKENQELKTNIPTPAVNINEAVEKPIDKKEEESLSAQQTTLNEDDLLDLDTSTKKAEVKPPHQTPIKKKETPKPKPKKAPDLTPPKKENTSVPGWLWALIIIVLLLAGMSILYFFTGVSERIFGTAESNTEVLIPLPTPTVMEPIDSTGTATNSGSESKPESPKTTSVTTRQHHVIVASFKNQSGAETLKDQLINKGFKNASVIEKNGRYLVSAEWHPSVSEALRRQEIILNKYRMENWVLSINAK
ncbi:SPOR domain-containing protein [Geofilum sp. OHC36d9]|uniref:SPOR domain-containing protein n=1 Tax=Geofilum sp. OHC36d9 TaxID=3458413 RepID=UPI0040349C67